MGSEKTGMGRAWESGSAHLQLFTKLISVFMDYTSFGILPKEMQAFSTLNFRYFTCLLDKGHIIIANSASH